jgi:hypothetical protein
MRSCGSVLDDILGSRVQVLLAMIALISHDGTRNIWIRTDASAIADPGRLADAFGSLDEVVAFRG